jgi:hypothetical protein
MVVTTWWLAQLLLPRLLHMYMAQSAKRSQAALAAVQRTPGASRLAQPEQDAYPAKSRDPAKQAALGAGGASSSDAGQQKSQDTATGRR